MSIIEEENPSIKHLVRITCRELENWYLGDLAAVEQIYPKSKATKQQKKAKFRNPDKLTGSEEMKKFDKGFSKIACAREISGVMDLKKNVSPSFGHFISGLSKLIL